MSAISAAKKAKKPPPAAPFNAHGKVPGGRATTTDVKDDEWTVSDSANLYHLQGWGAPYFHIGAKGHIEVDPFGGALPSIQPQTPSSVDSKSAATAMSPSAASPSAEPAQLSTAVLQRSVSDPASPTNATVEPAVSSCRIDLFELVQDMVKRGHTLPLLVRFDDILADRIRLLNEAFAKAIQAQKYGNVYRGVFPVKVCQQHQVIKQIVEYGKKYQYGLEAGSKPELLIVLAMLKTPGALITCNGYKDSEYIETALLAQRLGKTPIVIIEKLYEIDLVISAAKKLGIRPFVGVRAKLTTKGTGRWGGSTGDHAKFGLSTSEIMKVVERLRANEMLGCLQLLHFHIGSQITRIQVIKDGLREASQFFVQLAKLGADMKYIDVGGGLGIDYDGSKTSFHASMNYSVDEYAADVVAALQSTCSKHSVPVPTLVSESGRATASHMTVLVMSTLEATSPVLHDKNDRVAKCIEVRDTKKEKDSSPKMTGKADDNAVLTPTTLIPPASNSAGQGTALVKQMTECLESLGSPSVNLQECWHDAQQFKEEAFTLFTMGQLSIEQRAKIETLYWDCCKAILPLAKQLTYVPEELQDLERLMSATYYCNFSLFQSAPDNWAIDQLFPIMPIHRLNEKPTQLAILADLTCDSDGKIDKFICSGTDDVKEFLEVHPLVEDQPYYIAMFLNGAYQEVLGSLHNMYGDTNVVHVRVDPSHPQTYIVDHVIKGDTTDEVLRWMQYDTRQMTSSIREQADQALRNKVLTAEQYKLLVGHFEKSLQNYTYLED